MFDEGWMERAACRGLDVELFYSDAETDSRAAVRICRSCPVRRQCLDTAMAWQEPFGIWGGTLESQRRRVFRRQQRQADAA